MKKTIFLLLCLCLLLCAGCKDNSDQNNSEIDQTQSISETAGAPVIDRELLGVWVSANPGEREMVERLYFYEDASLIIELDYQGSPYGTLYGTYTIDGHYILCDITEGTTPYKVNYEYRLDGRMLTLTDDDGPANYLRAS